MCIERLVTNLKGEQLDLLETSLIALSILIDPRDTDRTYANTFIDNDGLDCLKILLNYHKEGARVIAGRTLRNLY